MFHQLFTCRCFTSCLLVYVLPAVCLSVLMSVCCIMHLLALKVSGHWWFMHRGNLHVTPETNMSNYVADSACDIARCQLCNQLSEPALSANPAVHL